jgi:CubicO group peptidase (beta-lactamase class C family)
MVAKGKHDGQPLLSPGPSRAGPLEPWGYGWNGGTGAVWTTDPDYGLTGILLSTRAMTSPEPPAHMMDFLQAAYGALAG